MPRNRLPWRVASPAHGCCNSVGIQDTESDMVADVVYREDGPLIAAAPDLYDALRMTTDSLIMLAPYPPAVAEGVMAIVAIARAAIAKVETTTGDE